MLQDFAQATRKGKSAAYLGQRSPDQFDCHLGNLDAGESCDVRIEFAMTLKSDSLSGAIRFELPMSLSDEAYQLTQKPQDLRHPEVAAAEDLRQAIAAMHLATVDSLPALAVPSSATASSIEEIAVSSSGDISLAYRQPPVESAPGGQLVDPFFTLQARVSCTSAITGVRLKPSRNVFEVVEVISDPPLLPQEADDVDQHRQVRVQGSTCPRDPLVLIVEQARPYGFSGLLEYDARTQSAVAMLAFTMPSLDAELDDDQAVEVDASSLEFIFLVRPSQRTYSYC
jgi:hypothetical protein